MVCRSEICVPHPAEMLCLWFFQTLVALVVHPCWRSGFLLAECPLDLVRCFLAYMVCFLCPVSRGLLFLGLWYPLYKTWVDFCRNKKSNAQKHTSCRITWDPSRLVYPHRFLNLSLCWSYRNIGSDLIFTSVPWPPSFYLAKDLTTFSIEHTSNENQRSLFLIWYQATVFKVLFTTAEDFHHLHFSVFKKTVINVSGVQFVYIHKLMVNW